MHSQVGLRIWILNSIDGNKAGLWAINHAGKLNSKKARKLSKHPWLGQQTKNIFSLPNLVASWDNVHIRSAVFSPKSSAKMQEVWGLRWRESSEKQSCCLCVCVFACVCARGLSCVQEFLDPISRAHSFPSVHGDASRKNSRGIAISYSRGSFHPQGSNPSLASPALAGPLPLPLVKPGTSLPVTSSWRYTVFPQSPKSLWSLPEEG